MKKKEKETLRRLTKNYYQVYYKNIASKTAIKYVSRKYN